jgi:hypothetical protein
MSLKIDYVWCNSKSDFVWYTKSFEYSVVVNYIDIIVNLVKSDIMNAEPPSAVVNLYIRKKITKIMEDSQSEESPKFAYFIKDLEEDIVHGVFSLVEELATFTEIKYTNNLIIVNHDGTIDKNLLVLYGEQWAKGNKGEWGTWI